MSKLDDHNHCPNPVKWGSWSPVKTVYVRDTDRKTGKQKWIPVGRICTGCGVFRHQLYGHFLPGKIDPECKAWQPAKEPLTIDTITISLDPGQNPDIKEDPVPAHADDDQGESYSTTLEAHIDYGGPGKGFDLVQTPSRGPGRPRTRISPEMVAQVLRISPDEVREKLRIGEIPGVKDRWRHWRVSLLWYENMVQANE